MAQYLTYEQPYAGQSFSLEQMEEQYISVVDKLEYPDFDTWLYDMLRSGVYTKVNDPFEITSLF